MWKTSGHYTNVTCWTQKLLLYRPQKTEAILPELVSTTTNTKETERLFQLHAIEVESLDAVLISNWMSIVGLPFLTRQSGFRADVYATDPTVQLGRFVSLPLFLAWFPPRWFLWFLVSSGSWFRPILRVPVPVPTVPPWFLLYMWVTVSRFMLLFLYPDDTVCKIWTASTYT